jgi:hypothetical protein
MHSCTFGYETPGDGMAAPARYTATIARVKKIFFRRSGVVRADRKALSTDFLLYWSEGTRTNRGASPDPGRL